MANMESSFKEGKQETDLQSTPEQEKIESDVSMKKQLTPEEMEAKKKKVADISKQQSQQIAEADDLLKLAENGGAVHSSESKEEKEGDPTKEYEQLQSNISKYLALIDPSYPNAKKYEKDYAINIGQYTITHSGHETMGSSSIKIQRKGSNDIYSMSKVVSPNAKPSFSLNNQKIDKSDFDSMTNVSTIMQSLNTTLQKEIEAKTSFQTLDSAGLGNMLKGHDASKESRMKSLTFTPQSISLLKKAQKAGFTLASTGSKTNSFVVKNGAGINQGDAIICLFRPKTLINDNLIKVLSTALESNNMPKPAGLKKIIDGGFDTNATKLFEANENKSTFDYIHNNWNNKQIITNAFITKFTTLIVKYMTEKGQPSQIPSQLKIEATQKNGERVFSVTGGTIKQPISVNFGP